MCVHVRSTFVTSWTRKSDCLSFPSAPWKNHPEIRPCLCTWSIDQVQNRVTFSRQTWIFASDSLLLIRWYWHVLCLFLSFFFLIFFFALISILSTSVNFNCSLYWLFVSSGRRRFDCVQADRHWTKHENIGAFLATRIYFSYVSSGATHACQVSVWVGMCDDTWCTQIIQRLSFIHIHIIWSRCIQ